MRARWLLVLLALAAQAACGDTLQGKVVRVSDGDTLTLLVEQQRLTVRLSEIDAPELKQAFGQRARQSLDALCGRSFATVRTSGKDRFGRVLGRIECGGIDANAEQVRRGMAWVFDRYVTDPSLYALQVSAREARLGLWADQAPMTPWQWRAENRR